MSPHAVMRAPLRASTTSLRTLALVVSLSAACASATPDSYGWVVGGVEGERSRATVRVRWSERLTQRFGGAYIPVEFATAGLDHRRDRVYVGTSEGAFFAFDSNGRRHYRYDPRAGIEAAPAVDPESGDVYLAAEDGVVHALRGRDGHVRWKESAGGAVRQPPVLSEDAVYVVTEADQVTALSRESGDLLWTYEKEAEAEYFISGRAGLTLHEGKLLTGFSDGTVVALDAASGTVLWERPTHIDIDANSEAPIRFDDVDTTPVVVDETVYVASFMAGVYALSLSNGSVEWREPERTGVTGLASEGRFLVLASADHGVTTIDRHTRETLWSRAIEQGAPTVPVITASGLVLVGESQGSLLAFHLRSGEPASRISVGAGFSGPVSVAGDYGWVLSNGGRLVALAF